MRIDALAFEPQFLDHIAPVWRSLPDDVRGTLYVAPELTLRSSARGTTATPIDPIPIRASSRAPSAMPGDGPMALAASIGDIKVGRRMGYRRFVFIEHGAGQAYDGDKLSRRHPSYSGGADREDVGLFLVPNEYSASRWRAAYPDARVVIVGSPHVGDLPDKEDDRVVVALSFHWPAPVAPEARTAIGYYGPVLRDVANTFDVIGHGHPKGDWQDRMDRWYRKAGIMMVRDFDEVCRRASVYVCDNSSTLFEFAATGRPVVVLNHPDYRRNVHHGLRFWDAAHVGVNVDRPSDLIPMIRTALVDPPDVRARREDALKIVYPADDIRGMLAPGRAAKATAEYVLGYG